MTYVTMSTFLNDFLNSIALIEGKDLMTIIASGDLYFKVFRVNWQIVHCRALWEGMIRES